MAKIQERGSQGTKKQDREKGKTMSGKASTQKSRTSGKSSNREFAVITYCFIGLFLCTMGYFAYFQVVKSEDFINNSYNTRQESFADTVVRGKILASDGEVLAETKVDKEGNETREYPYDKMFSHIVGYSTEKYGRAGIESWANFNLLRSNENFLQKTVDEVTEEKSMGDNVVTTLNPLLQEISFRALGDYKGAVITMEPSTGKVLSVVSKPGFDPNTIEEDWDTIVKDEYGESVLVNRATQGLYPPGSTFKILTTLAYVREHPGDYEEYSYSCSGQIQEGNSKLKCFSGEVHGTVNLKQSFSESCNTSFANMGLNMDSDKFAKTCSDLLFNKDLPVEKMDSSKSSFVLNDSSSTSEVMESAIGQGQTLVTPLHMLMITSAVANDGVLMKPYVIDHTETCEGNTVKTYRPQSYGNIMTGEEAALLQEYMSEVVESGTGTKLKGMSYTAAGKTGSAEFGKIKGQSHAWFVGYAHREDKEDIAVAVIVEGAGIVSAYAVPIAKEVFDTYFRY